MARGRPFTKGHKLAKGGARPGAGRTTEWLKAKCQELVDKKNLIGFIADVASGEYMERVVMSDGKELEIKKSASAETRLKAAAMLLDRGFGKAQESVEISGAVESKFVVVMHPSITVQS